MVNLSLFFDCEILLSDKLAWRSDVAGFFTLKLVLINNTVKNAKFI
jgi:hypothetical protein